VRAIASPPCASFAAVPEDPAITTGLTTYGQARFASAIARGAVLGVHFHPEKSQHEGLALLTRFFRM
jgi:glutamine amidotransferase